MYVGNSVWGIREAGLQLYSVADGRFGSRGAAEALQSCAPAWQLCSPQPGCYTSVQLWACTLQSDAVFVCLSELPKWSGRPWSTRLPTARWYSPSTGWRPCWSARDFWWVFLIGSLTAVSLHVMNMQNTPSGNDDVFWIDGDHSGQLSNLPTGWTAVGTCLLFHLISQIPVFRWAGSCSGGARRKVSTRRKVV